MEFQMYTVHRTKQLCVTALSEGAQILVFVGGARALCSSVCGH